MKGRTAKCSAIEPLELLAEDGRVGQAVAAEEQQRGQHVEDGVVGRCGLVEAVLAGARWRGGCQRPRATGQQGDAGSIDDWQQPAAAELLEAFLREAEGEVEEERRLQRFSHGIDPEDSPVEPIELAGVLESVQGEGDEAEQIEVRGAGSAPAAEEDVEADDQVDEADDAEAQSEAAVERLGDDLDRRVERDAVTGDGVVDLAVGAGAIERMLLIGEPLDGGFVAGGATGDSGQKIVGLDAGDLAGQSGRTRSACRPPSASRHQTPSSG